MKLDTVLWLAGDVAQAVAISVLFYRRLWRTFPVFSLYVVQSFIGSIGAVIVIDSFRSVYATWYLCQTAADTILLFGVIIEIAWSVLRPLRISLSRRAIIVVTGVILGVGVAIWFFSGLPNLLGISRETSVIVHLQQTVSFLQIIFFLALTAGSQFLSISWRDRELQIVSGLGFYSIVDLAAAMLHTRETSLVQYRHLDQALIGAWVCTLLYWIVSFARKEPERRPFTPEMQRVLLAVAGAARANRVVLTESRPGKPQNHDRR